MERRFLSPYITEIELYSYHNNSEANITLDEFIHAEAIVEMNDVIKKHTIKTRKTKKLEIPDAIIVASAMYQKFSVITADVALGTIEELKVVLYAPQNS